MKNNCTVNSWYLDVEKEVFRRETDIDHAIFYSSTAKTAKGIIKRAKQEISLKYPDFTNRVFVVYGSYSAQHSWAFVWWPDGQVEQFWFADTRDEHIEMLKASAAFRDDIRATIGQDNGLDFSYLRSE